MKKLVIGSTLAVGLLFAGANQSSAASIQGVGYQGMAPIDLSSVDLETALKMVQQQRTNLLENQLQTQLTEVQTRNEQLAGLNEQLNQLNAEKGATTDTAKQAELDGQLQTVQNQINTLSNSQQMDMLRMQSMNSKRNEAFDAMTNFVKKMQDSRSSILGNIR
ncbi:hypothetical protein [Lysinibacillus pakistanensis]|uniref:Secreted protein n=1 Tax=Lysinibacillus pakistanensis TaxID=759811 RepID=A0AAX3WSI7_9BACI|nr:hypothetical protein [Lysinibacillus pakistanensis]MDM5234092.1 hypothetical protein [Lysinibacillus pakistanensis]WHY49699.1 hypothetical protein QNH24_15295 [Lysinibacillus pakistanensis]